MVAHQHVDSRVRWGRGALLGVLVTMVTALVGCLLALAMALVTLGFAPTIGGSRGPGLLVCSALVPILLSIRACVLTGVRSARRRRREAG